jgi:3-hydroxyacyl-CoA dehydrogenase/enoyl-CoA hydratase/3-hydroxybutyryl-CoA epimerase
VRLPRLIGLPAALDIILNGKKLAARPAQKRGLVDALAPREHLRRIALECIGKGKPRPRSYTRYHNPVSVAIIRRKAAMLVAKNTRGNYPAIPLALDVVTKGISESISKALRREEEAVVTLVRTDVSRNLLRIFFLQDHAKRLRLGDVSGWISPTKSGRSAPVATDRPVMVVGAGVMGAGIAQWLSARGVRVLLRDIGPDPLLKGLGHVAKTYQEAVKRYIFSPAEARHAMERVVPVQGNVPFSKVGWMIEAVVENMDVKKKVFAELDAVLPEDTIMASNTSGLSITELGRATGRPDRVIGLHLFNPVHRMQLVEVVAGEDTSSEVIEASVQMIQKIGKLPVLVKDRPGFLVNRILMPYLSEAGSLFATGARAEDIDGCMLDFGMPMGPLRLLDEVGIDVADHVARHLAASFGDRMPIPHILADMMKAGYLGRKSGAGFYRYRGARQVVNEGATKMINAFAASSYSRDILQKRMVLLMVNEAARCMEEHLVASADDVDFAMIMGTGFAPFRGGPLRLIDAWGAEHVVRNLLHFAKQESKFNPAQLLRDMVNSDAQMTTHGGDA